MMVCDLEPCSFALILIFWVGVSFSDDFVAFVACKLFLLNPAFHTFVVLLGLTPVSK